ncbi:MAG: Mth938-like domain-containing protein [Rhodoferax sp.]|nr:Mth938-like domain-containing protein [Rhodoferax sp.]
MKIHPDIINVPFISSYGKGWVQVAGEQLTRSVVLSSDGKQFDWSCARFEELTAAHFEQLAQLKPELVIFGSGERLRFPNPALTRALIECQIGIESMDTQAACRTYNILAGEGRHVAVALLMESFSE